MPASEAWCRLMKWCVLLARQSGKKNSTNQARNAYNDRLIIAKLLCHYIQTNGEHLRFFTVPVVTFHEFFAPLQAQRQANKRVFEERVERERLENELKALQTGLHTTLKRLLLDMDKEFHSLNSEYTTIYVDEKNASANDILQMKIHSAGAGSKCKLSPPPSEEEIDATIKSFWESHKDEFNEEGLLANSLEREQIINNLIQKNMDEIRFLKEINTWKYLKCILRYRYLNNEGKFLLKDQDQMSDLGYYEHFIQNNLFTTIKNYIHTKQMKNYEELIVFYREE
jgi:hypothetical protein